jgi:type IV pilus assembly protein PilP
MRKVPSRMALALVIGALTLVGPTACGGDEEPADDGTKKKATTEEKTGDKAAEKKSEKPAKGKKGKKGEEEDGPRSTGTMSARAFRDTDFVESEQNRDPFRSALGGVKPVRVPTAGQRPVLMPNTPIDSVKLIAIVTGIAQPRAMIVDEKGVGYVATRGDFVGQAEVVQSGASENLPVTLNWRVDRIRENEVVFAREDPTGPNRPPLTKVLALHTEEEREASAPIRSDG